MAGPIKILCFYHPSMELPFNVKMEEFPLRIQPEDTIQKLISGAENLFEQLAYQYEKDSSLQVNVIWNTRHSKKPLNPASKVGDHFRDGDTCGLYGDILEMKAPPPEVPEEKKIPVTILTGFLGAGKTTLLNYILQEQREKRIAIIENEFGEVSIDDALLTEQKLDLAEKIIVMDNGCMCCTIRGDLVKGLQDILDSIHEGSKIDAIMIETTGMADPVPIVRTFMGNPEITQELRLDGVVCVADAKHLGGRLDDKVEEGKVNEAYQQVAFSDKIILNKIDLVGSEEAIAIKDKIRGINAFAKVLPAVKSRVPLKELSNMRAHDMSNFANVDIDKEAETAPELQHGHGGGHGHDGGHSGGHGGGHGHGAGHGHDVDCNEDHGDGGASHGGHEGGEGHGHGHVAKKSRHDSRVNSFAVVKEGEIIPQKLSTWMQSLGQLPAEKGTIFRIKAILAVKGHPYKHVFHAVMDVSDEDDAGPWGDEKKVSKIVFIGKGLDHKFLRDGFEGTFEKK
jgi:G3E family GTPase